MLVLRRTHRASRASQPARGKVEELSKNKHPKVCVLWGRSRIGENGKEDVEGSTYIVKSTASECYYHNNNNVTGIGGGRGTRNRGRRGTIRRVSVVLSSVLVILF